MRILWTLPYLPWPTTSGSKTRQYHLLRQLAQRGHRITLLVQSKVPLGDAALEALHEAGQRTSTARYLACRAAEISAKPVE
jgi:hypothetical protein